MPRGSQMDASDITSVYKGRIGGIEVRSGDLIFTSDGGTPFVRGQFWRLVGMLIPGPVDHVAIYVGPGGRCVEAGAQGRVIAFEAGQEEWNAKAMLGERGFVDTLYGVGYPLEAYPFAPDVERKTRMAIANFCLFHAMRGTPYNLNFVDAQTTDAFYCSQLAYAAYLPHGIDLNTGVTCGNFAPGRSIVFPQEVWDACAHRTTAPRHDASHIVNRRRPE